MTGPYRRSALAAGLLAVAVLVPTAAWYVVGSREAAQRGEVQARAAVAGVQAAVQRDAERLGTRLEQLRISESGRPFYHYQNLYHDPRGAAEGLAVIQSPLALGPTDHLIRAHFQIDDQGRVSLPTVNDQFPELSADQGLAMYCSFLSALQDGAVVSADANGRPEEERVLVLGRAAWEQNLLADAVYATLTGRQDQAQAQGSEATTKRAPVVAQETVVIRVTPLRWRTIIIDDQPVLAALREVATPTGTVVQGFALDATRVTDWLDPADPEVRFLPPTAAGPGRLAVPVAGCGWNLQATLSAATALATHQARAVTGEFRQVFAISAAAAFFAAGAVVLLVAQADRMAYQRARFAAAAAHELKTPLATLRLYSEMLAEGLGDPDRAPIYATRIATEGARLGRVVSNMLDLARLERGATLVNPVTGSLGATVAECVARLRPALAAEGLAVELTIAEDLPEVRFDPDAVCQILHNLLDNAEKHTRSGSRRRVELRVGTNQQRVTLTVSDSGPGVPRHARGRLFVPFSRATADDGPPGLGLGLALARTLARAQGGDIEYAATATSGATFIFSLPGSAGSC